MEENDESQWTRGPSVQGKQSTHGLPFTPGGHDDLQRHTAHDGTGTDMRSSASHIKNTVNISCEQLGCARLSHESFQNTIPFDP